MKIAIVGSGFSGLIWAERMLRQGHEVVVFEKSTTLGGVWRTYANRGSRVQMVAADYDFWERPRPHRGEGPQNFTPREEILAEALDFAMSTGVYDCIQFSTEVRRIERNRVGCTVHVRRQGADQAQPFDAVAVLPGTLTRPRALEMPGAESFAGRFARGIGDDVHPDEYRGKRVAIVGMGSFAIENAREALEHGAAHVTLVARSYNIIAPKIASLRICNHLVWKGGDVVDTLRAPYEALGRTDLLSKLQEGATHAQKTIPPVSDVYFVAQRFGRLTVVQDEVERVVETGVALRSGGVLGADILLGCVGFERTATSERLHALLGPAQLNGMFVDRRRDVAFNFEPRHGGMDASEGIPFASHLTITRTLADLFAYYVDRPKAFARIADDLPSIRSPASFSGADYKALFRLVARRDRYARSIVMYHLASKVARAERRYSEREFVEENRAEWDRLCTSMGGSAAEFPYPFRPSRSAKRRLEALLVRAWSGLQRRRVFGAGSRAPTPPATHFDRTNPKEPFRAQTL